MSEDMFLEVYATEQGNVKIFLADDIYVVMTPENARKLSDAILEAVGTPTPPQTCDQCNREMIRRETWVCPVHGEEWE